MTLLRAAVFNALFLVTTALLAILFLPLLLAPPLTMEAAARYWIRFELWLLARIVGLDHRVLGNLPDGPFILAAKHQSAWETFAFNVLLKDPVFVIKRELFWVPFYGWYAKHAGMIGIDRKGRAATLRKMVTEARAALAANRPIVIFPEGTRTAPGTPPRYQPGIAALYQALAVPVVPCALNSGLTWGRRAFLKKPGTITVEYLPAIPPGLPRETFMRRLEDAIETATASLATPAP
ncbi:MAG: lysophospholipid acyltransferase family protein [Gemmatimonas sp.]